MGCWGAEAKKLVSEIGHRIKEKTGDSRSGSFLMQRLAIAIQRGNAASVMGTFAPDTVRASSGEAKAAAAMAKLNGPGFPVKRDIEMERLEAKAKRQYEEEMEKDKFITIEDQAAAARSMKLDALHDPSKFIGAY